MDKIELLVESGALRSKMVTESMARFVKKTSYGFEIDKRLVLERLETAAGFIARMESGSLLVHSIYPPAFSSITRFAELTDSPLVAGRFVPGTLTNASLKLWKARGRYQGFIDVSALLIVPPPSSYQVRKGIHDTNIQDRAAMDEASRIGIPTIAILGSDGNVGSADLVIPCNMEKGSLAALFYILAESVLSRQGKSVKLSPKDF